MQSIRSLIFYILLILSVIFTMLFCWWILFLPTNLVRKLSNYWAIFTIWLLRITCGVKVIVKGRENILNSSAIYASKHQSALETFVLGSEISDGAFTLKNSLYYIPIFGWFLARSGMIGIDRKKGSKSIKKMLIMSKNLCDQGKSFILFPEGTRRSIGADPNYKSGVYMIYKELGVPIVPVAHNTGLFWPKNTFVKKSGTVTISFLPAIETGLSKTDFMKRLIDDIEAESNRLAKNP